MYSTQLPIYELFCALNEYAGNDAYADILEPWPDNNAEELNWLADFQRRTSNDWSAATNEDECRLYTLFRVTSLLLLCFQKDRGSYANYKSPSLPLEGIQLFLEQLGFQVPDTCEYHPFYHEILSVDQAERSEQPVAITQVHWPCFMLGDMIYCRSGVSVFAGKSHVVKEIAESSTLYWTYRRKDRPCHDQSYGWGHNSSWRTAHRRDYRTKDRYHYNIGGRESLNDLTVMAGDMPRSSMIELVRNRCMITTQIKDSDLYPYSYTYTEDA